jgi:hypothetical protein
MSDLRVLLGSLAFENSSCTFASKTFVCDVEIIDNEFVVYIHPYTINKSYYESVEISFDLFEDVVDFIEENLEVYEVLTKNE